MQTDFSMFSYSPQGDIPHPLQTSKFGACAVTGYCSFNFWTRLSVRLIEGIRLIGGPLNRVFIVFLCQQFCGHFFKFFIFQKFAKLRPWWTSGPRPGGRMIDQSEGRIGKGKKRKEGGGTDEENLKSKSWCTFPLFNYPFHQSLTRMLSSVEYIGIWLGVTCDVSMQDGYPENIKSI